MTHQPRFHSKLLLQLGFEFILRPSKQKWRDPCMCLVCESAISTHGIHAVMYLDRFLCDTVYCTITINRFGQ